MKVDWDKKSYRRFQRALKESSREVEDLRIPLEEVALRFMRSRQFIFKLKGPGQYRDLSPLYKLFKTEFKKTEGIGPPGEYPILRLTGALEKSITRPGGQNIKTVERKSLTLGTRIDYADNIQKGKGQPARPFLFWGPESKAYANDKVVKKQNLAMAMILLNHVEQKMGKNLKAAQKRSRIRAQEIFD